jgi:hypothetical protein
MWSQRTLKMIDMEVRNEIQTYERPVNIIGIENKREKKLEKIL